MVIIVGLGNPGEEYTHTRHNVGWIALTAFVEGQYLPSLVKSGQFSSLLSEGVLQGHDVSVLLPTTFMNRSGGAVLKYLKAHSEEAQVVVVHDDVALPFGEVRISYDRGAGGHNGVKSIIDSLTHARFARVRIGIAPKNIFGIVRRPTGEKLSQFVLGEFKSGEKKHLPDVVAKVSRALELIVTKGVEHAMQEINK